MTWNEIGGGDVRLEQSSQDMNVLCSGRVACPALAPAAQEEECEPLFMTWRVRESESGYRVTRHRRTANKVALTVDTVAWLGRIG